jgi:hypothetical protein
MMTERDEADELPEAADAITFGDQLVDRGRHGGD